MENIQKISTLSKNISVSNLLLFTIIGLIFFRLVTFYKIDLINLLGIREETSFFTFILNTFFILVWVILFVLLRRVLTFIYKFLSSFRPYSFNATHWPAKWLHQGRILLLDREKDALYITDSNSGCILKNHYWKNFEIRFKCKFPKDDKNSILGIIFRAKSLSDYFMIQINNNDKDGIYGRRVNPHIRVEGIWEPFKGPQLSQQLKKEEDFDVVLRVVGYKVELMINNKKELVWILPTNTDIKISGSDSRDTSAVPKIDFLENYGMVGFRAYSDEGAIISNLSIDGII